MTSIYRYQPFVAAYSNFLIVSIGNKTGSSTRSAAIYATAATLGKSVSIKEIKVNPLSAESDAQHLSLDGFDAIIVLSEVNQDVIKISEIISLKSSAPVFTMDRYSLSSYSDEYETALLLMSDSLLSLAFLLPDNHPNKATIMSVLNSAEPTVVKPDTEE